MKITLDTTQKNFIRGLDTCIIHIYLNDSNKPLFTGPWPMCWAFWEKINIAHLVIRSGTPFNDCLRSVFCVTCFARCRYMHGNKMMDKSCSHGSCQLVGSSV